MVLRDLIAGIVGLIVGGLSCLVVYGVLFVVLVAAVEFFGRVRRRVCRRRNLRLEQYRAEQALRHIRRQAIHDLLDATHTHQDVGDSDVIEGTAVEIR